MFPSNSVVAPQSSLYSFNLLPYNYAVAPKSFIVLFFFPSNSFLTLQSFILFLPVQQCCDTTKFHCTHSFSSHPTMLWHHKASLYSFYFFPYNSAVVPCAQSFIVLILFLPFQQCCDTTKLHCIHLFITIQQCCDNIMLHCPHSSSHHKASLSSFFFFASNSFVVVKNTKKKEYFSNV